MLKYYRLRKCTRLSSIMPHVAAELVDLVEELLISAVLLFSPFDRNPNLSLIKPDLGPDFTAPAIFWLSIRPTADHFVVALT